MTFGNLLQNFRNRCGYSTATLGKEIGLSQSNISAIEHGKSCLKADKINEIAGILSLTHLEKMQLLVASYEFYSKSLPMDFDEMVTRLTVPMKKINPDLRSISQDDVRPIINGINFYQFPIDRFFEVIPDDDMEIEAARYYIFALNEGQIKIETVTGDVGIIYGVKNGSNVAIALKRVFKTDTTASNILLGRMETNDND